MYVKKIRAAGLVAAAAAAAALFSAAPASAGNAGVLNNDLVDLLAWQVCGSNAALVGAQVPLVLVRAHRPAQRAGGGGPGGPGGPAGGGRRHRRGARRRAV